MYKYCIYWQSPLFSTFVLYTNTHTHIIERCICTLVSVHKTPYYSLLFTLWCDLTPSTFLGKITSRRTIQRSQAHSGMCAHSSLASLDSLLFHLFSPFLLYYYCIFADFITVFLIHFICIFCWTSAAFLLYYRFNILIIKYSNMLYFCNTNSLPIKAPANYTNPQYPDSIQLVSD